jgi:hypothetical protein
MYRKVNDMKKLNSRILFIGLAFSGLLFGCQCTPRAEHSGISPGRTSYFIDPVNGDDDNSGSKESRAWRTFTPINRLQLAPGDRVEITSPGSFDQTLILRGEGNAEDPVEVHFADGRYDFFTHRITRKKYNISNTNSQPDSLKAIGILVEKAKHFNISGPGAEIICRGKMIEVCIDSCEDIALSGLSFDYHRPTVSEFQVVEVGEDYVDLQIHRDSEYRIEDGNIIWYGEGWTSHTRILGQELDLETNDVRRLWNPIEGMQFEEIQPDLVRARGEHRVKKDHVYQLRETFRDYAAVFTRRSKNISWKNVHFYFLHGMGLVSQFSENLTYDAVSIAPDSTGGRTTAAWADILHVSGCRGKVLVKDCVFRGAHDDAINVHGTYLQVVEKITENQVKLRFMHPQTYGFLAVNPGDEIEFVDGESYESHGLTRVRDAILINPREILVTLEKPVPGELDPGDVIENVTWTPEVEIRGCKVSWIPTRGFLLATRKKVLVEENEFLATHMSAILVGIDANKWFESGYVRDMTIRNNRFVRCAEPVIHIEPMNSKPNNNVHRNIRIENNRFLLRNELVLQAKSASNISVTGNTIFSENKLNDDLVIMTNDCSDVKVAINQFIGY